MSATSLGFIHGLCVALAHRLEPERIFVILTAYLDESGTHGGDGTPDNPASDATVMAGMMGTTAQWMRFNREFDRLRRRDGFRIFHAKDFRRGAGEFSGWSYEKCERFILDLYESVSVDRLMFGTTFRLDNEKFKSEYLADRPRKPQLDTAYGFCFRNCVFTFALEAERRLAHHKRWKETKIGFVLESGHRHVGDAERIYSELKAEVQGWGLDILGPLTFATKKESAELSIGDCLAHTALSMDKAVRKGTHDLSLFGSGERGKSNLAHVVYAHGGLAEHRQKFIETAPMRKHLMKVAASSSGRIQ
jgi:hypothetical protein